MTAYEETLRRALELLEDLHAQMEFMAFNAFEADLYRAIGATYGVEPVQVRENMADLDWLLTETED